MAILDTNQGYSEAKSKISAIKTVNQSLKDGKKQATEQVNTFTEKTKSQAVKQLNELKNEGTKQANQLKSESKNQIDHFRKKHYVHMQTTKCKHRNNHLFARKQQ
jgi:vacuolar-type H+-ATPase subunit H